MFEWIPRTLIGFLAPVGGADGVDLAGFALGQVKVLSRKVHCMSLSSIHILYNHTPAAPLRPHPELCCGLIIFHWTEVVLTYETGGGQRTYVHNTIADQHSTQISDQGDQGKPGKPGHRNIGRGSLVGPRPGRGRMACPEHAGLSTDNTRAQWYEGGHPLQTATQVSK